jgi:Flp pilus assembly protein TadD, contains TPR repeats
MIGVQICRERKAWMETASQQAKRGVPVMLLAMLISFSGCKKYVVIVDVPVPAKVSFDVNIKEFKISQFEGPAECASDLQNGIKVRAMSGGLVHEIPGLPDMDGPLEVNGKVDTCSMRMGYGVLNATMFLSHGGKQLHQEIVKEETNRSGASTEEVRTTLVKRVIDRFAAIFVPTSKKELREFRPHGDKDPGWIAAREGNWKLANEAWTKRVKENPNDDRAWYNRGVAYEANGQLPDAVKDYKKAVELDRDELYMKTLSRAEGALQARMIIETAKKARE